RGVDDRSSGDAAGGGGACRGRVYHLAAQCEYRTAAGGDGERFYLWQEEGSVNRLTVLGGGSWGTALAMVLAPRFGRVSLWTYEADLAAEMASERENKVFLPGFRLPPNIDVTSSLEESLREADMVLGVMPSTVLRQVYI